MTILPKKKPPPPSDPEGNGERSGSGGADSHSRSGARPRSSPPPRWAYPGNPAPPERHPAGTPRPQQASPPPCSGGSGGAGSGPLGEGALGPCCCCTGAGGCCSGPGHSKRRRQGVSAGPGAPGSSPDREDGAGNNSEDEYETAARTQAIDPDTAEQQEHWFEKALQEKKGFIIKQMKEDGACLFRAVADQVYGDQDMHEVVRKHCMDYLMKNADYFSNYVTEDFTTYINRKRKNNCHGNHIEMQAMAEMYNRPVEVYQYGTEPINTFHGIQQNEDEPIRVSYHRNIHYNSVVNPNKATIGVGLGLPSFKPGFAEQSLMKSAIRTSEESWIEQQMLEDKKRATDWEATNEAIEEQVARESYLQWLRDQEKQARQPRKASATCSSATAAASSGLEEWSGRSPRQRSTAGSPEHPDLHAELCMKPPSPAATLMLGKPPSPCAPGPSNQTCAGADRATSPLVSLYPALECRAIMQHMSPTAFGLKDWDDDEILASVLAVSQQEYLDTIKKSTLRRDSSPDHS
ncbi:OTU domain-containing protein 5 [Xenopus tropicalis]|uniref:OTU domain-containing protein 5 n=1 Tax=Xenopus tropicalis TaxID=8364 RepID=OTUD5_XENTR|nr:OTU domain-containing protein 5 [Xenopus tropicalis]Q6GL44.1 RecName: Full=OTU domain-containing protein 5; AltName: Full=Deubiquitinating enzyme A; Short=DUBA [Xenopus tropicalis]AAH74667.1 MGC69427 protein [Xenopus tropicalis]|eukprot:NP_001004849.1 OTU domain-containing protein 5 [Xenopus tropicalis]